MADHRNGSPGPKRAVLLRGLGCLRQAASLLEWECRQWAVPLQARMGRLLA